MTDELRKIIRHFANPSRNIFRRIVACAAGGILSRVRGQREAMAAEPPILAAKSGSFPFFSRLRRPYSLSTVKILPRTRTIPLATQARRIVAPLLVSLSRLLYPRIRRNVFLEVRKVTDELRKIIRHFANPSRNIFRRIVAPLLVLLSWLLYPRSCYGGGGGVRGEDGRIRHPHTHSTKVRAK